MNVRFDFTDRVAVVTGGSGVLGSAVASALGECGASVVVLANSRLERAEAVAARITSAGGRALALQGDVLSRESLAEAADRTVEALGRVDFLVNAAGGAKPQATTSKDLRFFDLPEDAVRRVFDLNFMGTFLACQEFGERLVKSGSGAILNFSSMGAVRPLTRSVAYSAGKAAVTNFTQWLAVHLGREYSPDIRVNALVPGFFLTEQNRFLLTDEATGELTERGRRIIEHTPMGRFGEPDDLIGPALWLLSDSARFVHGSTLVVDGGLNAYGGV